MSLKRCSVNDLFGVTSRKLTDEGFLVAEGNLARAGNVQEYRSRELGLDGGDKIVRLFRPKDEVFHEETIRSFDGQSVTLNHPKDGVTAQNWRSVAVGDVHGVKATDEHMAGTLIIRDKDAIRAVMEGRKDALSNGYTFDYDPTPGTTADGKAYDGIQRQIRGNHVAIVDFARGGSSCRIQDSQTGDRTMRKIVVDGISIELEDTQASIVEKATGDAATRVKAADAAVTAADKAKTDAETALAAEKAATVKLVADHAAKVADLEKQILKPEQIEKLAADRVAVVGDAAKVIADFKAEGKTNDAIRAEVLTHVIAKDEALKPVAIAVMGGADVAKAEPAMVTAAFRAVVAAKGTSAADRSDTRDSALGRALAGGGGGGDDEDGVLYGADALMARSMNGGKQLSDEDEGGAN